MLVLTRKKSEMIQIGSDIIVKVIRTGPTTVKIGIDAPDSVRILRTEIIPDFIEPGSVETESTVVAAEEAEDPAHRLGGLVVSMGQTITVC